MAADTRLFSRYLSAFKHTEHQYAGPKKNILTSTDKLLAFKNKIQVWKKHLSSGNIEMFPLLLQIQDQSEYKEIIPLIVKYHTKSKFYNDFGC
jgi:hypothetical protein